jgi:hypothetical protein
MTTARIATSGRTTAGIGATTAGMTAPSTGIAGITIPAGPGPAGVTPGRGTTAGMAAGPHPAGAGGAPARRPGG